MTCQWDFGIFSRLSRFLSWPDSGRDGPTRRLNKSRECSMPEPGRHASVLPVAGPGGAEVEGARGRAELSSDSEVHNQPVTIRLFTRKYAGSVPHVRLDRAAHEGCGRRRGCSAALVLPEAKVVNSERHGTLALDSVLMLDFLQKFLELCCCAGWNRCCSMLNFNPGFKCCNWEFCSVCDHDLANQTVFWSQQSKLPAEQRSICSSRLFLLHL